MSKSSSGEATAFFAFISVLVSVVIVITAAGCAVAHERNEVRGTIFCSVAVTVCVILQAALVGVAVHDAVKFESLYREQLRSSEPQEDEDDPDPAGR